VRVSGQQISSIGSAVYIVDSICALRVSQPVCSIRVCIILIEIVVNIKENGRKPDDNKEHIG
jgi:hypothetical protein